MDKADRWVDKDARWCSACRVGSPARLKAIGAGFFKKTGTYKYIIGVGSFIKTGTYSISAGYFTRIGTYNIYRCRFYVFPLYRGGKSFIGVGFKWTGTYEPFSMRVFIVVNWLFLALKIHRDLDRWLHRWQLDESVCLYFRENIEL